MNKPQYNLIREISYDLLSMRELMYKGLNTKSDFWNFFNFCNKKHNIETEINNTATGILLEGFINSEQVYKLEIKKEYI